MADQSILYSAAPYHVISYGTLLGTQFFESFVGSLIAYKKLPRPQFSTLQQSVLPVYFSLQTALPVILALTYPGEKTPLGSPSSLRGVFAEGNGLSVLTPLLTVFGTSVANLLVFGPGTTKIIRQRKHQETKDGKKYHDTPPHSEEMTRLNKQFARMHGISSLLNVIGFLATVWYGVTLASRIH